MTETILNLLRRVVYFPIRVNRRRKAKKPLISLSNHNDEKLQMISIAIQETLANSISDTERNAITQIEKRRADLLASDQSIGIIDFGAGSPDSNRTKV